MIRVSFVVRVVLWVRISKCIFMPTTQSGSVTFYCYSGLLLDLANRFLAFRWRKIVWFARTVATF